MNSHLQQQAHKATRLAIRIGLLHRPNTCSKCGGRNPEAHHNDYAKPMEVEWLCKKCHHQFHKNRRFLLQWMRFLKNAELLKLDSHALMLPMINAKTGAPRKIKVWEAIWNGEIKI